MKFVLFVEGQTEKACVPAFLKRWLDSHLDHPVGIQPVRFAGWQHFEREFQKKSELHLNGPSRQSIIAVVGLLDLYGPTFYPGNFTSADQRYDWAVSSFERKSAHPKFRMFFAVHEIEAWLLSQPTILPREIRSAIPPKAQNPETVNFEEPPAKLLDRVYRLRTHRGYKKHVYGKELFQKLDPVVAVQKCPRLRFMLEEMLRLAKGAGL